MGCTQSKIENEEAVARCKERKQHMKEAVSARNAFAAAHSSYAMSLKNTGAVLSDYAHGEAHHSAAVAPAGSSHHPALPSSSSASAAVILDPPPVDNLPPPPPPPSNFDPAAPPQLQRAATMPEISIPKPDLASRPPRPKPIVEDEEEDDLGEAPANLRRRRRGGSRGGGGGGARGGSDGVPPVSAAPPATAFQQQQDTYDFFFNYDNVPRPTLGEMEAAGSSSIRNEEIDRNSFDEIPKRLQVPEEIPKVDEVKAAAAVVEEEAPPPPPPPPEAAVAVGAKSMKKAKQIAVGTGQTGQVKRPINLLQIFVDLDDHFLKASESAHEVSKMLEATRLHYHSNFADNRGHIDHSARVMRVITWNRSFRGLPNNDDGKDDFDSEENETHATVLDKLLAWEKKLYDEVKAGEVMKFEYQRKVNSLSKLKNRSTNSDALEKAKASVSLLHTRYIVDMQAMDSTVSEINRLRDQQLYPKLVQLVDGMATMWETMRNHHESQSKMAQALRFIDITQTPKETSETHHNTTAQLLGVVHEWRTQFDKLVHKQREYIQSLHSWLKLNLIPTESSLKEKVSSPPRPQTPPILKLLIAWEDHLEKLPDEVARSAITNFAAVIDTIVLQQEEEMRLRERCEDTRKELSKKRRAFEDWYHKYMQSRDLDHERTEGNPNDPIVERQSAVDLVERRLKEEQENYQRHCLQVREKSLVNLRTRLPELFRALCEFSVSCSAMYSDLRAKSQPRNRNESSV